MKPIKEDIISFISSKSVGVLSTLEAHPEGYPFGSIVNYAQLPNHSPIIHISPLAEHFKNLTASSKSSLFIFDSESLKDPYIHPRATLIGDFIPMDRADEMAAFNIYSKKFPDAESLKLADSFRFFRLTISKIRWIAGFGEMGWLSGEDLLK